MRRIAVLVSIACACAHGGESRPSSQVSDADFGRLQPGQMGPVEQARVELRNSEYQLARAKLQAQQSTHEGDLAKAEQKAADAQIAEAEAKLKAAQDRGDQKAVAQAQRAVDAAKLLRQTADAHLDYASKLASARQAQVDVAQQQVSLSQARIEQSKLEALQQANIPAASQYDPAVFRRNLADSQVTLGEAQKKEQDQSAQAQAALQSWRNLSSQYQAAANRIQQG